MYNLFQRVNAVELLKLALSAYIRATGQGIIMDEEKDKELVPFLLEFKASLDKILEESFAKNEAFSNTIKDSFEQSTTGVMSFIVLPDLCFSFTLLYLYQCQCNSFPRNHSFFISVLSVLSGYAGNHVIEI
jgi:hypothetical protein